MEQTDLDVSSSNIDPYEEFPLSAETDTAAAIDLVLGCKSSSDGPRMVLRHQLYCLINNEAEVNSSLDVMRETGAIRTFSVPFYPKDLFLMYTTDFESDIRDYYDKKLMNPGNEASGGSKTNQEQWRLCKDVMLELVATTNKMSIFEDEVRAVYNRLKSASQEKTWDTAEFSARISEKDSRKRDRIEAESASDVSSRKKAKTDSTEWNAFLRDRLSGFLLPRRDVSASNMYYMTHPQMGLLIKWINTTRSGLLRTLSRSAGSECSESRFNINSSSRLNGSEFPLKSSPLGWKFHLYDSLGAELVVRYTVGKPPTKSLIRTQSTEYFIKLLR